MADDKPAYRVNTGVGVTSKKHHEGYLLMDNRAGDPIPVEVLRAAGLPEHAGRGMFETALLRCNHCQAGVVKNPLRTRERAYCRKCDHYICDNCGVIQAQTGGECRTVDQMIEEVQEREVREEAAERSGIIIASK